jgi:gamma-carbonic anhydrase
LENQTYIGIGATILDGAIVRTKSMVAPGSLVLEKTEIPSGELWSGVPAKFLRKLTIEEQESILINAANISELSDVHELETTKEFESLHQEMEECDYRDDKLKSYVYLGSKSKFIFNNFLEVEDQSV